MKDRKFFVEELEKSLPKGFTLTEFGSKGSKIYVGEYTDPSGSSKYFGFLYVEDKLSDATNTSILSLIVKHTVKSVEKRFEDENYFRLRSA